MSSIFYEIDRFRNNQLIIKLERELVDITDEEIKKKLSQEIEGLKPKEKINTHRKALDDMFKSYDKNQFRQQWRYLTPDQKEIKLKEFNKDIDPVLLKELTLTNKGIKYDVHTEKIIKIGKINK